MIVSSKASKKEVNKVIIKGIESSNIGDDIVIDNNIRPSSFDQIVGREQEKTALKMMIESAKNRGEALDHILFYGPPGLGKTTFAMAISSELGSSLRVTSGPAIDKPGDLAAILTNLKASDILFIDEIHRLSKSVEEILYPAMEDRVLDIVMGKGASAKTVRLNLEPFTLVGATTQIGKISSPMRDRFGLIQRLDYFELNDLDNILRRASGIWEIEIDDISMREISNRSRGTARVALRLLKRIRDYVFSIGKEYIDIESVNKGLSILGIDSDGLESIDSKIIDVMYNHYDGGPVGLSTLAAAISEDISTLEEVYEPFLMKKGYIKRTNRGRVLTTLGINKALKILNNIKT